MALAGPDGRSLASTISTSRRRRASARASSRGGLLGRLRRGSAITSEGVGEGGGGGDVDVDAVFALSDELGSLPEAEAETAAEGERRRLAREAAEAEAIARGREAAARVDLAKLNGMLRRAGGAAIGAEEHADFRGWMARREARDGGRDGSLETTLDPEDYEDLYVEMHELYRLSDDFARLVVAQRAAALKAIHEGHWEDDEGFLALHHRAEELKRLCAQVGVAHQADDQAATPNLDTRALVRAALKAASHRPAAT